LFFYSLSFSPHSLPTFNFYP